MCVADRVILHRAKSKTLRGGVGRLLQPAVIKHQRFGLAVFQEQLAVVGALQPARDLMAHGIAVEIGAVEQGGCRWIGHENSGADVLVVPADRGPSHSLWYVRRNLRKGRVTTRKAVANGSRLRARGAWPGPR